MTLELSLSVNLFCSFLWIFRSAEDVTESLSNLRLTNIKVLDVEKLNNLLSLIDKTWILPCPGAHKPIGSNFKYKQTCENIYQNNINNNICQQIGFGIMCFNYCYEQGEILEFQCQDISDPIYCKNNSAYDQFLAKYQNDPYKAKSYIRQMISRCYATAICDSEHGILNTTIIDENSKNSESDNENQQTILQIIQQQQKQQQQQFLGNAEIIDENSSKEISIEDTNSSENKQEKVTTEETTISTMETISTKDENEVQLMERLWWLCKALQQMNNNNNSNNNNNNNNNTNTNNLAQQ
ncbi:Protein CBR-CYN-17 [Dirofilaria immitis]|nr:Protein CBR-CYN-17 [Dirofilaria immitis]